MGKVNESWFIRFKGASTCMHVRVHEITQKTVIFEDLNSVIRSKTGRHLLEDVEWIELCEDTRS